MTEQGWGGSWEGEFEFSSSSNSVRVQFEGQRFAMGGVRVPVRSPEFFRVPVQFEFSLKAELALGGGGSSSLRVPVQFELGSSSIEVPQTL